MSGKPKMSFHGDQDTNLDIAERTMRILADKGEILPVIRQYVEEALGASTRDELIFVTLKFVDFAKSAIKPAVTLAPVQELA